MTARWVRVADVLWRRTLDGMVALAPDGETLHLSPPAAALVSVLETPHSAEEAAAELAAASGADVGIVRRDVDALLDNLAAHDMVRALP